MAIVIEIMAAFCYFLLENILKHRFCFLLGSTTFRPSHHLPLGGIQNDSNFEVMKNEAYGVVLKNTNIVERNMDKLTS